MNVRTIFTAAALFIAAALALVSAGQADELARPYDSFQAGADAAARHDARKRQSIALQLGAIDQMKWYSGIGGSGLGSYYGYQRPDLDWIYAYGAWGGGYDHVFQPWPYVPGDIWGYRWDAAVRQPIGRREIQTGPNRWESHPVYTDAVPALPPVVRRIDPLPEITSPPSSPSRPPLPRQF